MEIEIRPIIRAKHSRLKLEGTVLIHCEERAGVEMIRYIPVEWVNVSGSRRYNGRRLITALLFLLAPLVTIGIMGIFVQYDSEEKSIALDVCVVLIPVLLICGLLLFIVFLVRFLHRVPTVRLEVASQGFLLEFWKEKGSAEEIEALLEQIETRQSSLEDSDNGIAVYPMGLRVDHTILFRVLGLLYFCALPALVMQQAKLLVLLAIPLIWYLYRELTFRRHPPEYRQAMQEYLCGRWQRALEALDNLESRSPSYVPGITLASHIHMRSDDFDKALEAADKLPDTHLELKRYVQDGILRAKRLYKRRSTDIECDAAEPEKSDAE